MLIKSLVVFLSQLFFHTILFGLFSTKKQMLHRYFMILLDGNIWRQAWGLSHAINSSFINKNIVTAYSALCVLVIFRQAGPVQLRAGLNGSLCKQWQGQTTTPGTMFPTLYEKYEGFKPSTPKILMLILPSSCYTFPCKLVKWIWC